MTVPDRQRWTLLPSLLLLSSLACAQGLQSPDGDFCQASALVSLTNAHLQFEAIDLVRVEQGWPAELPAADNPAELPVPAFCRIKAQASAGEDSLIHMEVWVPVGSHWNGKLVGTGNGGFNPALSYNDMLFALRRGYAVVGGDTGHQGKNAGNLSFGRGHPEKIRDWGERSIHVITVAAKAILASLMQKTPSRAYYYGCSTGGHQGLAEVQRYPDDFDGVIAGDPANNRIRMNAASVWIYQANHQPGDTQQALVTHKQAALVQARALEKCDALDGRRDGVLEDPRLCTRQLLNLQGLLCKSDNTEQCLTPAQITALEKIYQGLRNPLTGEQLYPGQVPGAEEAWNFLGNNAARGDFWRYWVFDQEAFDVWRFDFVEAIRVADQKLGPMVDSVNADLSAFRNHGGKLIVYQGWADPIVSPLDTIAYYNKVSQRMGSQKTMDDFYRLFVVPGMGHCGGGPGATVFGNASLVNPEPDYHNDLLMALDHWVEQHKAPATLQSVELQDGKIQSTRLLCSWPAMGGPAAKTCRFPP